MTERISAVLPELNPEVQKSNKERKNSWMRSGFDHIGSTRNGSFVREWTTQDFRDQIKYLKSENDISFYLRTILQDSKTRDLFVEKMEVSPDEFWENSYVREESPEMPREEYLEKHFWKALAVEAEIENVLKDLPDDFLLETLKVYNKEIDRIRIETLEIVDKMRQDFMPNFKDFVQRHNLIVNWEEIDHKFDTVSYDLFDQYYAEKDDNYKTGDYDRNSHTVRVEMSPFSRVDFGTLQHEHIHAISGRKNILSLISHGSGSKVYIAHGIPRLGASFNNSNRFKWLNEAITEHINIDIKGEVLPENELHEINNSYWYERELFELILSGGKQSIPARLFYQAYFESDTEDPKDLERRQELYQAISKAYGSPRFLVELDDMIKKIGVKEATKIFKATGSAGVRSWWLSEYVDRESSSN